MPVSIEATSAHSIDAESATTWTRAQSTLYAAASTMKLLTAYTARDYIADLNETATLDGSDMVSSGELQPGDTLTYSDLLHATLIRSNNAAAQCLARVAAATWGGDRASFYAAMHAKGSSLGWSGHVVKNAWGGGYDNRLSAEQLTDLLTHIRTADPWLFSVAGTLTHDLTVTGGRTLTIPISHTIDPSGAVPIPEFLAGKSGTIGTDPSSPAYVVVTWTNPNDQTPHTTAVMNSDIPNRYLDLRSIMDEVIATTAPTIDRRRGAIAAL